MSLVDSFGTCDRKFFRYTIICDGPCGLALNLTCTSFQPDFDPSCFDKLTWLCDSCRLFLNVPPEVWTNIFERLDVTDLLKIRLSCRTWKQLVDESPSLRGRLSVLIWSDYRLDYDPEVPPAAKVSIDVSEIEEVNTWWPTFGANLVSIKLGNCLISLATLLDMLRQAPLLKDLELDGIIRSDYETHDMAGADFKLDNLKKLLLRECDERKFLPTLLKMLSKMCPRLENLAVDENSNRKALIKMIRAVQGTLHGLKFDATSNVVKALMQLEKLKLKHITFLSVIKYDRDAFVNFFKAQSSLEYLCICDDAIKLLNEDAFAHLKLVSLKVQLDHDVTLNLGYMPTLKYLEVVATGSGSTEVTFGQCQNPNLKELQLICTQLVGISLANFLAGCPQLQLLSLVYVQATSCLQSLAAPFNSMKTLKIIDSNLPQPMLLKLFTLCPNLEDLELMTEVKTDVIRSVLKRFPGLRRLAVDCEDYVNCAKCIMKNHGQNLRQLDFKLVSSMIDNATKSVIKNKLLKHFTPWCRVRFYWSDTVTYGPDMMKF